MFRKIILGVAALAAIGAATFTITATPAGAAPFNHHRHDVCGRRPLLRRTGELWQLLRRVVSTRLDLGWNGSIAATEPTVRHSEFVCVRRPGFDREAGTSPP